MSKQYISLSLLNSLVRRRATLGTTTDRFNTDLATAVDQALAMPDKRAAAAFLTARGATFALTCRVLGQLERRRARDLDLPPEVG